MGRLVKQQGSAALAGGPSEADVHRGQCPSRSAGLCGQWPWDAGGLGLLGAGPPAAVASEPARCGWLRATVPRTARFPPGRTSPASVAARSGGIGWSRGPVLQAGTSYWLTLIMILSCLRRRFEEARAALKMDSEGRVRAIGAHCSRTPAGPCAGLLGRSYPAILRQFEAGGSVYAVAPAQSPASGDFDGQTPLRRAATRVGQLMVGLGMHQPQSVIFNLREAVDAMTTAQTNTEDPALLLQAVRGVVALADRLQATVEASPMTRSERETWAALGELRACYDRDRQEIEIAHHVQAAVAELSRPLADVPGFTRDLRPNR